MNDIFILHLKYKGREDIFTVLDIEDKDKIIKYPWGLYLNKHGYKYAQVNTSSKRKLHHFILSIPKRNIVVDHINGNTLDNRKRNLRLVDYRINSFNSVKNNPFATSKYKGVSWNKKVKKWRAFIFINNKQKYLGAFHSEIEAAKAYNEAARQVGDFVKLNDI